VITKYSWQSTVKKQHQSQSKILKISSTLEHRNVHHPSHPSHCKSQLKIFINHCS